MRDCLGPAAVEATSWPGPYTDLPRLAGDSVLGAPRKAAWSCNFLDGQGQQIDPKKETRPTTAFRIPASPAPSHGMGSSPPREGDYGGCSTGNRLAWGLLLLPIP
jgi:hypothetical protein